MSEQLNPAQLAIELATASRSGHLEVSSNSVAWNFFLENGKLFYASHTVDPLGRLAYHLRRLNFQKAADACQNIPPMGREVTANLLSSPLERDPAYRGIVWLREREHLNPTQTTYLSEALAKDALEVFLWLRSGTHRLNYINCKFPDSCRLDLPGQIEYFQKRLASWQNVSSAIASPFQRLYLFDQKKLQSIQPPVNVSVEAIEKLAKLLKGTSLRQLMLALRQDELKLAQLLVPYIQQGAIYVREPQPPFDGLPKIPAPPVSATAAATPAATPAAAATPVAAADRKYRIACVDDSPTILSEIQRFLGSTNYEIHAIDSSVKASMALFRIKPDLILLDIGMPEIDGYKLCNLLRNSESFSSTPIIMVSGNKGIIDKARAKLAGATDYLTKPFTQAGLTEIVSRYLA